MLRGIELEDVAQGPVLLAAYVEPLFRAEDRVLAEHFETVARLTFMIDQTWLLPHFTLIAAAVLRY